MTGANQQFATASSDATPRRILLTGGTGFVGRTFGPALIAAFPHAQRVVVRRPGDPQGLEGWQPFEADLIDRDALDKIIGTFKPDLILHLAAQSSVGDGERSGEATWRINFEGSLSLAGACARHTPGATFFFVSTSEVYGWSFQDGPAREDAALRPMNVYARAKAATESMLPDVLGSAIKLIVARPFNHTGPWQDERFALPAFTAQIAAIEAGRQPPVLEVGNLDAARDILDVRDVCRAYVTLLQSAPQLPARSVFNISSGSSQPMRGFLEQLRALSSAQFEIRIDPARMRPSDIPCAQGDSHAIADLLGWAPQISIEETLGDLLAFWRMRQSSIDAARIASTPA